MLHSTMACARPHLGTQLKEPYMPRTMCAVAAPAGWFSRALALFSLMSTPGQPRTRRPYIC